MQQGRMPVCGKCGYENPSNYCPNCGARQPRRQSPSSSAPFPWKTVLGVLFTAIILVAAVGIGTAIVIGLIEEHESSGSSPYAAPLNRFFAPPTATPIPPIHQLVTCREIADDWTLDKEQIRKITRLSVRFRGQDRMECDGWVDVEWAEDEWVTLGAERDYEGGIYIFIEPD